jgi:hypothetical protein
LNNNGNGNLKKEWIYSFLTINYKRN